jgi:hypothetical protein
MPKASVEVREMHQVAEKKLWEAMQLTHLGHVGEVVRGGGGKLSPPTHDIGDIRKPPGQA